MPVDVDAMTRDGWRELGFFYDQDDSAKAWKIIGSRAGIQGFAQLLRGYVAAPANAQLSEHEHFGPYMYLKIVTSTAPAIGETAISGTLNDLLRLADIVEAKLASAHDGDAFTISKDWAEKADFSLVFEVRSNDFDPPTADPLLPHKPASTGSSSGSL